MILTTGSQGETMSGLVRMATGQHPKLSIKEGDLVIISASPIPGNERYVSDVINMLYRKGASVINDAVDMVHVSGHACEEELKLMLSLVKPKYFIPVHGEYRHLYKHAALAEKMGIKKKNIFIPEIGSVIELNRKMGVQKETVASGSVLIDGLGVGDVGNVVLRDRKQLSSDGLFIVVVTTSAAVSYTHLDVYKRQIRGKAQLIKTLKDEAKKSKKVYLATDPDREGEAISWHIANILGLDPAEVSRIEFNEITKDAVTSAIKNPRNIDMDRVDAQQARRVLDRLVGYKLSPLLWKKVKKGLSAGRVQSVAVKVIVDRENEIRNFKPEEFWTISALLKKDKQEFEAKYYGVKGKKADLKTEADAQAVLDAVKGADFIIDKVKSGTRKKNALPPFTTSFLQQAASGKLGFTAKKTMMLAQMLYEGCLLYTSRCV